jgi:DNA-binding SARP family transcriptional activator/tetratricopeptide (TPR) repeat protein
MAPTEPDPRTRIRLCGPLALDVDGGEPGRTLPGGQAGALLAYLLSSDGLSARRDELIEAILPGRAPQDAQAALRPLLSRLRRAIAPVAIEGRERLRVVPPTPVWVDLDEATNALRAARAAAKEVRWTEVRARAEAALALVARGFLPAQTGDWAEARRRAVEEMELEALEWVARSGVAIGGPELVASERASRELVARAPFRETGHRLLMETLAHSGNAAEALRVYDGLRVLLRDELGAAPAAEIQALHQRLVAGEPLPPPPGGAPTDRAAPRRRPVVLPRALSPRERSAFVGREPELERLRELWREAVSGAGRLVLVAGEPGIGKSRLTSELAHEVHDEGTVLYASCHEEALVSYQPFVETLRQYARTTGRDSGSFSLGPGAGELARLVPELSAAPPAEPAAPASDPENRRYLLYDAVATCLTEASARAPLLLVLDDLHWADRATLRLLAHVVRTAHEARLLIVGTYRDAEVGDEHPLSALLGDLRRERLFERLPLRGLDAAAVGALIGSHGGNEPPSGLVDVVHEHTEGNPFFVEEVMRHLIETGVVFERDGRWTSAMAPDEIGVPEGVREVLTSRLTRLSEPCRTVLAAAAVLGREFSFHVLRAFTERDEDALIDALEEASAAQLLVEVEGRPGVDHAFTHALVRETLYATLTGPRRQRMHARAAAALEQATPAAPVATLAIHHRLAGAAGDSAKAIELSLQAGAQASELFAWHEAANHWEGALDAMARAGGREAERARLLVALAELMVVIGDVGRHIAFLEQALAMYDELGDARRAAQAHSRLGMALSLIDSIYAEHLDINRAFEHFDAARAVLVDGAPSRAAGHLETGVSAALAYGLRISEGMEAGVRGMEAGEKLGDEILWAGAAEAYAWHAIISGRLREGLDVLERAFEVADRHRRPFHAWMALNTMGQLTWGLGAPTEAEAHFERVGGLPYLGRVAYRQQVADGVGRCHLSRGEIDAARRLLPDAKPTWITHSLAPLLDLWDGEWKRVEALAGRILETSRRTGNRWDEWASLHLAARVAGRRGDYDRGVELMDEALAIVVDGEARYFELWLRPDLARVRAESGRLGEARAHVERCRQIMGDEDWRGRAGYVALAEGVVLGLEDRMDEADARFREAHAAFARHDLRPDEADALHRWGRALARAGDEKAAADKLDGALEIYRRYNAGVVWHERVEADLRRLRSASR